MYVFLIAPFQRPFRVWHDQADHIWPFVAGDHRLQDFGLQGQHALDLLRSDIFALVVDDEVFLAVRNGQTPGLVNHTDVAGMQPSILDDAVGFRLVAPIALHDQLAAHQYFAIIRDFRLGINHRWADRIHFQANARPVAGDDGAGLGR